MSTDPDQLQMRALRTVKEGLYLCWYVSGCSSWHFVTLGDGANGCVYVATAPSTRSIGVQVEMDEDMTTRALDLDMQVFSIPNAKAVAVSDRSLSLRLRGRASCSSPTSSLWASLQALCPTPELRSLPLKSNQQSDSMSPASSIDYTLKHNHHLERDVRGVQSRRMLLL